MNTEIGIGGLIFAGAITPGPNNMLILQLASARGLRSSLPAIAGVVAGGLTMLALGQIGVAATLAKYPVINNAISTCGAIYLAALGVLLVCRGLAPPLPAARSPRSAPERALHLFVFQFLNPKAWVLILTIVTANHFVAGSDRGAGNTTLLLLFAVISSGCLLAWAVLGHVVVPLLEERTPRRRFECVMGLLLIASAVSLVLT